MAPVREEVALTKNRAQLGASDTPHHLIWAASNAFSFMDDCSSGKGMTWRDQSQALGSCVAVRKAQTGHLCLSLENLSHHSNCSDGIMEFFLSQTFGGCPLFPCPQRPAPPPSPLCSSTDLPHTPRAPSQCSPGRSRQRLPDRGGTREQGVRWADLTARLGPGHVLLHTAASETEKEPCAGAALRPFVTGRKELRKQALTIHRQP